MQYHSRVGIFFFLKSLAKAAIMGSKNIIKSNIVKCYYYLK